MIKSYEIRFFAVGKSSKGGDAIFIRLYDDSDRLQVIVIDGGYVENGDQIVDYMTQLGLDTIDLMISTHPDIDHISGLVSIFECGAINVRHLIMNRPWVDAGISTDDFADKRLTQNSINTKLKQTFSKAYDLEQCAIKSGCPIIRPELGMRYCECLTILGPSPKYYRECLLASSKTPEARFYASEGGYGKEKTQWVTYRDGQEIEWGQTWPTSLINETSIICKLELPDRRVLLTADAGVGAITRALSFCETFKNIHAFSTIQLPHHGSRKNINPQILCSVKAKEYIISCPPDGLEECHPSARMVNWILWNCKHSLIYSTSEADLILYYNLNMSLLQPQPLVAFRRIEAL